MKFNWNRHKEAIYRWRKRRPDIVAFQQVKHRAKKNNIEFSITLEDLPCPPRCPVLDILLIRGKEGSYFNNPSVDRIDPKKGYIKGNVRIISQRANQLKSNASIEELEKVLLDLKEISARSL